MKTRLLITIYLAVGSLIGLGAFGHGFVGIRSVEAALAVVPLPENIREVIWIVWYFVSGCMLLCGALILWAWFAARRNPDVLLVPIAIALLWVVAGIASFAYQHDPFWLLFLVEGAALLAASLALRGEVRGDGVP